MSLVKKEILVDASPNETWEYFANPDLLAGWLMRNNFSGKVGEEFQFFAPPRNDWDGTLYCKLIELDKPKKLSFTWNANDIRGETLVTIELYAEDGDTKVRLLHTNFENAALDVDTIVTRHDAGWSDHIEILANQVSEQARGGQQPTTPFDWTRFDLHVAIKTDPETLLRYWATIRGMESFFVELMRITNSDGNELDPDEMAKPGYEFLWRWHNGRTIQGRYLETHSDNEVRFTFGDSNVCVTTYPYKDGALLRLTQYDIPDTEGARMHIHTNCRGGWVYFLTVLKMLVEHAIDGRDVTRATGASFSTYFDPCVIDCPKLNDEVKI